MDTSALQKILDEYTPITLEEMDTVKLMNRTDTKFLMPKTKLAELLEMAKESYSVCEINGGRILPYETTYMDTKDLMFFRQHLNGKLNRHKMRYRTYLTSNISFFEIKFKTNKERTIKWRIPNKLEDKPEDEVYDFMNSRTNYDLEKVVPALHNNFDRITLVGLKTKERITIDFNLKFENLEGNKTELEFLAIAELKREGYTNNSPFIEMAKKLGIRNYGFSKYCVGTGLLTEYDKKNILKPKFLLLNKIQNEYINGASV